MVIDVNVERAEVGGVVFIWHPRSRLVHRLMQQVAQGTLADYVRIYRLPGFHCHALARAYATVGGRWCMGTRAVLGDVHSWIEQDGEAFDVGYFGDDRVVYVRPVKVLRAEYRLAKVHLGHDTYCCACPGIHAR